MIALLHRIRDAGGEIVCDTCSWPERRYIGEAPWNGGDGRTVSEAGFNALFDRGYLRRNLSHRNIFALSGNAVKEMTQC